MAQIMYSPRITLGLSAKNAVVPRKVPSRGARGFGRHFSRSNRIFGAPQRS